MTIKIEIYEQAKLTGLVKRLKGKKVVIKVDRYRHYEAQPTSQLRQAVVGLAISVKACNTAE